MAKRTKRASRQHRFQEIYDNDSDYYEFSYMLSIGIGVATGACADTCTGEGVGTNVGGGAGTDAGGCVGAGAGDGTVGGAPPKSTPVEQSANSDKALCWL